jgi:UDP-2-acetamido-2,6-beta-L-arabino-hexul-4-ose reductase
MRIVVTGAAGFIGSNLCVRLRELQCGEVIGTTSHTSSEELTAVLAHADFVFHLAGVNRSRNEADFDRGNRQFTRSMCAALARNGRRTPVVFASSTQAPLENAYGRSKRAAEEALLSYGRDSGAPVHLFRLTNVFGKWCKPYYNSVVATFCDQLTHGLPTTVNDPAAPLRLLYVDDVVAAFVAVLGPGSSPSGYHEIAPVHETTVGGLERALQDIAANRTTLAIPRVGSGFLRALYATYVSYLPPESFAYRVALHRDARGAFVEMLKTADSGQFSFFTAHPGVTRGGHYHHSKTEKFLVVSGQARFRFRHLVSDECYELYTDGEEPRVVESIPGWAHDITNVGDDEMIVMLWANEVFDRARPDTYRHGVV